MKPTKEDLIAHGIEPGAIICSAERSTHGIVGDYSDWWFYEDRICVGTGDDWLAIYAWKEGYPIAKVVTPLLTAIDEVLKAHPEYREAFQAIGLKVPPKEPELVDLADVGLFLILRRSSEKGQFAVMPGYHVETLPCQAGDDQYFKVTKI